MQPETKIKILFNTVMFLLGALIPFMFFNGCEGEGKIIGSRDTIFSTLPPITNNYHFTNPTVYKEKSVVYDSTRPTEILSRKDSDLIVYDYLKRRYYYDSILNSDSSKFYYWGVVEKNMLTDLKIRSTYKPKLETVNNYIEPGPAIVFGGEVGFFYEKQIPTISPFAAIENKKYLYGIRFDYLQKQAAVLIGRRLNFKGKNPLRKGHRQGN